MKPSLVIFVAILTLSLTLTLKSTPAEAKKVIAYSCKVTGTDGEVVRSINTAFLDVETSGDDDFLDLDGKISFPNSVVIKSKAQPTEFLFVEVSSVYGSVPVINVFKRFKNSEKSETLLTAYPSRSFPQSVTVGITEGDMETNITCVRQ